MIPDELRDKHTLAIGKIAIAWNEYHELLGEIVRRDVHQITLGDKPFALALFGQ